MYIGNLCEFKEANCLLSIYFALLLLSTASRLAASMKAVVLMLHGCEGHLKESTF
jgi:hypothetical protein